MPVSKSRAISDETELSFFNPRIHGIQITAHFQSVFAVFLGYGGAIGLILPQPDLDWTNGFDQQIRSELRGWSGCDARTIRFLFIAPYVVISPEVC
jgi:hypothetical protein